MKPDSLTIQEVPFSQRRQNEWMPRCPLATEPGLSHRAQTAQFLALPGVPCGKAASSQDVGPAGVAKGIAV